MVAKISKFGKRKSKSFENVIAVAVFVALLVGIMGLFAYQNVKIGQKRSDLEQRLQELQAQVQELSLQGAALQESVAQTQTQEYEEKVLREQGLYKKQGEQVITVLPPETAEEPPKPEEKKEIKDWWNPIRNFLTNLFQ